MTEKIDKPWLLVEDGEVLSEWPTRDDAETALLELYTEAQREEIEIYYRYLGAL